MSHGAAMSDEPTSSPCCESNCGCVFAKALLSRSAVCELSQRRALAEREIVECTSPVARMNCTTLAALLHERARFALRLPRPGQPLMHALALRLQREAAASFQKSWDKLLAQIKAKGARAAAAMIE